MATFYAQPYDLAAQGFYFSDAQTYRRNITSIVNDYGDPVEEFEIQFIDGESIDAELAKALGLYQGNVLAFMEVIDNWDDDQKTAVIIAVGECGYQFDLQTDDPDSLDVTLYPARTLKELAEQFVEEGLFGEIPEQLRAYLDYDAIARDLAMDYSETTIGGTALVYHCA